MTHIITPKINQPAACPNCSAVMNVTTEADAGKLARALDYNPDKVAELAAQLMEEINHHQEAEQIRTSAPSEHTIKLMEHLRRTTRAIENMLENYAAGDFTATVTETGEPANFDTATAAATAARKYFMQY